jgi:hypothetical protein
LAAQLATHTMASMPSTRFTTRTWAISLPGHWGYSWISHYLINPDCIAL